MLIYEYAKRPPRSGYVQVAIWEVSDFGGAFLKANLEAIFCSCCTFPDVAFH